MTWKESGFPIETLEEIFSEAFQENGVVDVRSDREWESDQNGRSDAHSLHRTKNEAP